MIIANSDDFRQYIINSFDNKNLYVVACKLQDVPLGEVPNISNRSTIQNIIGTNSTIRFVKKINNNNVKKLIRKYSGVADYPNDLKMITYTNKEYYEAFSTGFATEEGDFTPSGNPYTEIGAGFNAFYFSIELDQVDPEEDSLYNLIAVVLLDDSTTLTPVNLESLQDKITIITQIGFPLTPLPLTSGEQLRFIIQL